MDHKAFIEETLAYLRRNLYKADCGAYGSGYMVCTGCGQIQDNPHTDKCVPHRLIIEGEYLLVKMLLDEEAQK